MSTPTEHLERWIAAADKPDDGTYPCVDCDGTLERGVWHKDVFECLKCNDYWEEEYLVGYAEGVTVFVQSGGDIGACAGECCAEVEGDGEGGGGFFCEDVDDFVDSQGGRISEP